MAGSIIDEGQQRWTNRVANWERLFRRVDALPDSISPARRESVRRGLRALRETLGADWLARVAVPGGPTTPLWWLVNEAPWCVLAAARFGDQVKLASTLPGSKSVLARTSQRREFAAAHAQIDLAWRLAAHEFALELEPAVGTNHADIKVLATQPTYLEIKVMQEAVAVREATECARAVHRLFERLPRGLGSGGAVRRLLSATELEQLDRRVQLAGQRVASRGGVEVIKLEEVYEFVIYRDSSSHRVVPEFQNCWIGPAPEHDETFRLSRQIHKACGTQLPSDRPGVIVLSSPDFGLAESIRLDLAALVEPLRRAIAAYPAVTAAVLMTGSSGEIESALPSGARVWTRESHGLFSMRGLVVENECSMFPVPHGVLDSFCADDGPQ